MKIFLIVAGSLIAVGGLLMLIASPILGLVFIAIGAAFLFSGIRYKTPAREEVFAGETFVGYVPRGSFPEIKECMIHDPVCSVEIFGGKYKVLDHDDEADYEQTFEPKYYRLFTRNKPVKAVMVFQWENSTRQISI